MKNKKMTDAYKNAIGTMFLLAGAFFICSTLLSMRTVLADPIAPANATQSRVAPARTAAGRTTANTRSTAARSTVARTGTSRATATSGNSVTPSRSNIKTRSVSVRSTNTGTGRTVQAANRSNTSNRVVATRGNNTGNVTMRGVSARNRARVVARSASTPSRVGVVGTGMRYSTNTGLNVSYLTSKLYTGNYSNIIDSTTGMISADAYSTCLDSYYTCMDEICTARSDAKGRCSCAGRATNFLVAEDALDKANEELIQLSGQLALLISTKGKDVSEAFKLTDAEKVMNCVSYKDAKEVAGTTKDDDGNLISKETYMNNWCRAHMLYSDSDCSYTVQPTYCSEDNNDFGFDINNIDGSSSDILASLKAWANAKDNAKQYVLDDSSNLIASYTTVSGVVNGLSGITPSTEEDAAKLDSLANKWGYELFEYAHNNVCGRVLDSCFNGIYEACGTPPSGTDSSDNKIGKCANGASGSCPYNYNSAIYVNSKGDVELNERGSTNSTTKSSAACFGYSTTTASTSDPYASLRGPVADARRSIMQKYLLDANSACDTYGAALKSTAQNINYQKIAAEQALRQKRMEFYNEEQETVLNDARAAVTNFNECISELWDCYSENADEENWSTARIKTYCAQVANAPHCYEPMICDMSPLTANAVIDKDDLEDCTFDTDYTKNTCRNVVTLNEILYRASGATNPYDEDALMAIARGDNDAARSYDIREACLLKALGCGAGNTNDGKEGCLREFNKSNYTSICMDGYTLYNNKCYPNTMDCTSSDAHAATAVQTWNSSTHTYGACEVKTCESGYHESAGACVQDSE